MASVIKNIILLLFITFFSASTFAVEPEVLTLKEAAKLLRVNANEVQLLAENKQLPARKIGTQWRFYRPALVEWLKNTENPVSTQPVIAQPQTEKTVAVAHTPAAEKKATTDKQPETIGKKSEEKTADQVFLRDQGVLLKQGYTTLEVDFYYSRSDNQNYALPLVKNAQGQIV